MHDIVEFRTFLIPQIIRALWLLGTVLCVALGPLAILANPGGEGVVAGLLLMTVGPVALRIAAELHMILFRIYEVLCELRDQGAAPAARRD